jgi:hypothetical protein
MPERADPPTDEIVKARERLASISAHPTMGRTHALNCGCAICKPSKAKT